MNESVNVAELEKFADLFPAEQIKSSENAPIFLAPGKLAGIDPRLVFLARAAARLDLVEAGEMDLAEAYGGLVPSLPCQCTREMVRQWDRDHPHRPNKPKKPCPSAAQSTYDALLYELLTHGIAGLQNANCWRRIGDLSSGQIRKLTEALIRLRPTRPAITDELILKLGDCL